MGLLDFFFKKPPAPPVGPVSSLGPVFRRTWQVGDIYLAFDDIDIDSMRTFLREHPGGMLNVLEHMFEPHRLLTQEEESAFATSGDVPDVERLGGPELRTKALVALAQIPISSQKNLQNSQHLERLSKQRKSLVSLVEVFPEQSLQVLSFVAQRVLQDQAFTLSDRAAYEASFSSWELVPLYKTLLSQRFQEPGMTEEEWQSLGRLLAQVLSQDMNEFQFMELELWRTWDEERMREVAALWDEHGLPPIMPPNNSPFTQQPLALWSLLSPAVPQRSAVSLLAAHPRLKAIREHFESLSGGPYLAHLLRRYLLPDQISSWGLTLDPNIHSQHLTTFLTTFGPGWSWPHLPPVQHKGQRQIPCYVSPIFSHKECWNDVFLGFLTHPSLWQEAKIDANDQINAPNLVQDRLGDVFRLLHDVYGTSFFHMVNPRGEFLMGEILRSMKEQHASVFRNNQPNPERFLATLTSFWVDITKTLLSLNPPLDQPISLDGATLVDTLSGWHEIGSLVDTSDGSHHTAGVMLALVNEHQMQQQWAASAEIQERLSNETVTISSKPRKRF